MDNNVSPIVSALVASWIAGPMYGVNAVLVVLSIWTLSSRGLQRSALVMVAMVGAQFMLSTGHLALSRVALVQQIVAIKSAPTAVDSDSQLRAGFLILNIAICSLFLTWTVWGCLRKNIVWGLALLALNLMAIAFAGIVVGMDPAWDSTSLWPTAFCATTVLVQLSAAILIAGSNALFAWGTPRVTYTPNVKVQRCDAWFALGLVVDSGIANGVGVLFLLVFYRQNAEACIMLQAILAQLSAAVPMTMILRNGSAQEARDFPSAPERIELPESEFASTLEHDTRSANEHLVVKVTRFTQYNVDSNA